MNRETLQCSFCPKAKAKSPSLWNHSVSKTFLLYVHIKYFSNMSGIGRQSELHFSCLPTFKINIVVI